MDQFLPHPNATFEGYYVRFTLNTGASIVVVVCTVPHAQTRPHMLSFTYIPQNAEPIFQREVWATNMSFSNISPERYTFSLETPAKNGINTNSANHVVYNIIHADVNFHAETSSRVPWSLDVSISSPEGFLARFPLPLHWHVHSLASPSTVSLSLTPTSSSIPIALNNVPALAHIEKNWATSFPTAHIWLQAYDASRGASICGAGGKILGVEAFILGYRNPALKLAIDIRPPWAMAVGGYAAPGLSLRPDWKRRCVQIMLRNWRWRVSVKATAPKGSFFGLSAPMPEGHRFNGMAQSLKGHIEVVVWKRSGWWWAGESSWMEVARDIFVEAGLEFGGLFYPGAGSEARWN